MGIIIEGTLKPGKKVDLLHPDSGARITTAAPLDNNGDGSSFSPTDLVAAALISCSLTVMSIVAERNQYDLGNASARVEKIMNQSPRRIAALPIEFHLPAALNEDARRKMEGAARSCPVHHSLLPDIQIEMKFVYDL